MHDYCLAKSHGTWFNRSFSGYHSFVASGREHFHPGMDEAESLDRAEDFKELSRDTWIASHFKALFDGIMMPIGGTIPPWTETRMGFMTPTICRRNRKYRPFIFETSLAGRY